MRDALPARHSVTCRLLLAALLTAAVAMAAPAQAKRGAQKIGSSAKSARLPRHVPFPPARPQSAETARPKATQAAPPKSAPPAAPKTAETEPAPPNEALAACMSRLSAGVADVVAQPPLRGAGACGADDVVRLEAVWTRGGKRVALHPAAQLRCGMAEALATWVRDDVTTALAPGDAPLAGVTVAASYDCRGRNNIAGARLSQHGLANAIDLRALRLADGREFVLTDAQARPALRHRLRESACARFTTVLGPASDGYHEEHIHMDLIERRSGYRICQWAVHEPAAAPAKVAAQVAVQSIPWPVPVQRPAKTRPGAKRQRL